MSEPFDTVYADLVNQITPMIVVDQGVNAIIAVTTAQLTVALNMALALGASNPQMQPFADCVEALQTQSTALAAAVQANTPAETGASAITAPAGPDPQRVIILDPIKPWPTLGVNPSELMQADTPAVGAPADAAPPPPDNIPAEGELSGEPVTGEVGAPPDETAEARQARLEHNLALRRAAWDALYAPVSSLADPNALPPGYQPTDRGPLTDAQAHGQAPVAQPAWGQPAGAPIPPAQPVAEQLPAEPPEPLEEHEAKGKSKGKSKSGGDHGQG